jgi:hypothetical protein
MTQPLVLRPPYAAGGTPVGESGLPGTGPSDKGVSLDSDIPGSATFAKPSEEDARQPDVEDSSMYKVDDADDLLKDQGRGDEIDHSKANPTFNRPGPRTDKDYNETHYPYRDGIPNRHNAALVEDVVQLYLLRTAHEVVVSLESPIRVAAKISDIEDGLNPNVRLKARSCSVGVKRVDVANLRWIFTVDCGNGSKMVRLKAARKGNITALARMDVSFSCSCKAWRWLGSEYHAKQDHYLDGKPTGTASTPDIKDPTRVNRVCKHVAAVIGHARKWSIPTRKRGK